MDDLISRQAAIEHLKKRLYETALNNVTEHPYYEDMADNRVSVWLEEVPSAQPERNPGKTLAEEVERIKREITDIFAEQMGVQPSAQSKRMRGRWVKDEEASSQHCESIYVCSACNNMDAWGEAEKNTFKFCPNCGADMRGEKDG